MSAKEIESTLEVDRQPEREELERKAERARARLLSTIDALEQRGHDALDVKHQVEAHIVPVASFGIVVLSFAGGAIALSVYRASDARRHRGRERVRALARLWRHPERALRVAPRSILAEIGRKVVLAALSVVAVTLTKRVMREIVAAPQT